MKTEKFEQIWQKVEENKEHLQNHCGVNYDLNQTIN